MSTNAACASVDAEQYAAESSVLVLDKPRDMNMGVSNCYIFKCQLQEYAQKHGFLTPVYNTIKEGFCHAPMFRSTVTVNGVRYDSLPGFPNRKASEQSAAEVALQELTKSGEVDACISGSVPEMGLCKNLLQEYAQKMSYASPRYECKKGSISYYSCTVNIGGIRYTGAAAKSKKEAEIKAARTAILSIKMSNEDPSLRSTGDSRLTIVPYLMTSRGNHDGKAPETLKVSKSRHGKKKSKRISRFLKRRVKGGNQTSVPCIVGRNLSENVEQIQVSDSDGDALVLPISYQGLVMKEGHGSMPETVNGVVMASEGDKMGFPVSKGYDSAPCTLNVLDSSPTIVLPIGD